MRIFVIFALSTTASPLSNCGLASGYSDPVRAPLKTHESRMVSLLKSNSKAVHKDSEERSGELLESVISTAAEKFLYITSLLPSSWTGKLKIPGGLTQDLEKIALYRDDCKKIPYDLHNFVIEKAEEFILGLPLRDSPSQTSNEDIDTYFGLLFVLDSDKLAITLGYAKLSGDALIKSFAERIQLVQFFHWFALGKTPTYVEWHLEYVFGGITPVVETSHSYNIKYHAWTWEAYPANSIPDAKPTLDENEFHDVDLNYS